MPPDRLTLTHVRFERGGRSVIDDVSLRIGTGEWITLLGPNGAGKTTLIKLVTGQLAPRAGTVQRSGVAAGERGAPAVGLVPQEPALFDTLDVGENLAAFAELHAVPRRERVRRVRDALAWSGLETQAGNRVATLSGGMVRRLNIACATLHRPPLLVLDEPTVGVDAQAREQIYAMLRSLQRAGTALLYSTHLFEEAERYCTRLVVLDRGRIVAGGTPGAVRRQAGLAVASVLIDVAPAAPACALEGLERRGNRYTGFLADPLRELPPLLHALATAGVGVERIVAGTPCLDEVYFALTGRSLRA